MLRLTLENPPKGYSEEAEYRVPLTGEECFSAKGNVTVQNYNKHRIPKIVLKKLRWRAEKGEPYYSLRITDNGFVSVSKLIASNGVTCIRDWRTGNYFETEELAKSAASKIEKVFAENKND